MTQPSSQTLRDNALAELKQARNHIALAWGCLQSNGAESTMPPNGGKAFDNACTKAENAIDTIKNILERARS